MIGATGFTLIRQGLPDQHDRANEALVRAMAHFPELKKQSLMVGETRLVIWGRNDLDESIHILPDGSMMAMIGTPLGELSWEEVEQSVTHGNGLDDFRILWDGRVVLLHVNADGQIWKIWNDWLGSIPIYYADSTGFRIASTLEPIVVASCAFGSDQIYLPGLIFLLIHGNFFANWTLYQDMHTVRPDSVTTFDGYGNRSITCRTIAATDMRWESGWDDLVDEMHSLVERAISDTLKMQEAWIVPLSSGLDSRLIAAIGADIGSNIQTYTWGPSTTRDGVYSRQIARALNLPWRRIDLGDDYLFHDLSLWVDLFGSSMHFHGMYQVPFLEMLSGMLSAPIISGLIGECLAGYDVHFQSEWHHPDQRNYVVHPSVFTIWTIDELKRLFRISIEDALEEIADVIEREKDAVDGPWFQKLRFLTLWGRQNHFTYFQSMLSDYFRGVATPYLNRSYARFCLSLPRAVLDERHLQIDMMRRYYPRVMNIGGTYAAEPAILTGRYLLKRRFAKLLPTQLVQRVLPAFTATKNIMTDVYSLRVGGKRAIWPIPETRQILSEWLDPGLVDSAYDAAIEGDMRSVQKIQSIQPFAYRLYS